MPIRTAELVRVYLDNEGFSLPLSDWSLDFSS
jgi:hypothetical protein